MRLISQLINQIFNNPRRKALFWLPFRGFVCVVDYFYPKDPKLILFGSNSGQYATGSSLALYEHIRDNHPDYKVKYFLSGDSQGLEVSRIKYVIKNAGLFFRAKVLVSTHPPSDFSPLFWWSKRKIMINVWHGTPLKSIYYDDANRMTNDLGAVDELNRRTTLYVVSSKLEASLVSKCFLLDPDKYFYCGHPRNDQLLKPRKKVLAHLFPKLPKYQKVILYAPTFRRNASLKLFPFSDLDEEKFQSFLERNQLLILVRKHKYDQSKSNSLFSDRIVDLGFHAYPDLNSILPDVDILVTDYSSSYIDFMLLDRPCIFISYDLRAYIQSQGLTFDDYDYWTPGRKIQTQKEFLEEIEKLLVGNDEFAFQRKELCRQLNFHQTDHSCEDLFLKIQDLTKE